MCWRKWITGSICGTMLICAHCICCSKSGLRIYMWKRGEKFDLPFLHTLNKSCPRLLRWYFPTSVVSCLCLRIFQTIACVRFCDALPHNCLNAFLCRWFLFVSPSSIRILYACLVEYIPFGAPFQFQVSSLDWSSLYMLMHCNILLIDISSLAFKLLFQLNSLLISCNHLKTRQWGFRRGHLDAQVRITLNTI